MRTKKTRWGWAAALLMAFLALGSGLTACDTGGGGTGTTTTTTTYDPITYSFSGGELTITRPPTSSKVAFTPQTGDSYTLKIGSTTISTGTITVTNTTSWSFSVSSSSQVSSGTFTATVTNTTTLTFNTTITYSGGSIPNGTSATKSSGSGATPTTPTTPGGTSGSNPLNGKAYTAIGPTGNDWKVYFISDTQWRHEDLKGDKAVTTGTYTYTATTVTVNPAINGTTTGTFKTYGSSKVQTVTFGSREYLISSSSN